MGLADGIAWEREHGAPDRPTVAKQRVGVWLPIETAPKDGSLFLAVARLGQRNQWVSQCKWIGPDKRYPNSRLDWFMGVDGWPQPSHWMPIPDLPSPTAAP
ncbi:hypothetical protein HAAEEKHM_00085 [Sinorhizobium phage AP-16-3]|nr:hypothetical protein HAAEEKHM_00085 [Sinorhizobium phage AP-16-3]